MTPKKRSARKADYGPARNGNLFLLDGPLWKEGHSLIAGVDEAGRGPLAGPVVAAAVIFEPRLRLRGLDDSKLLDAPKREVLFDRIMERALAVGVGVATAHEIDELNIYAASHVAARRALAGLSLRPDCLITDMLKLEDFGVPCHMFAEADGRSHAVAAASVVAKVTRDRMMLRYHEDYPEYAFDSHKGYYTPQHIENLRLYGPSTLHRQSFAPVREVFGRLRWSRTFERFRQSIEAGALPLEWETSPDTFREYLPPVEWEELTRLAGRLIGRAG